MKLGVLSLAFRCTLAGGQARTSEESDVACWWTLEEFGRDAPEARAVRVLDAVGVEGVSARAHDGSRLIEARPLGD